MPTIKLSKGSKNRFAIKNGNGSKHDFKVRDLSLAESGRKEITIAEQ